MMATDAGRQCFEFGTFRLDVDGHLLLRDGKPVSLTPKAFDILLYLVRNPGRLSTRDELMKAVWPDSFVEETNLTVNISFLRKTLGEMEGGEPYIETVPRKGYRFNASVSGSDGQPHAQVRSIAVMPFMPLSPGPSDEYLGLGMADALITRLSNIRQVVVRPASTVRKYEAAQQDPIEVGRQLGVETVLQGSIRRSGDRTRVIVRLLRVRDGDVLWGERFDENFADMFAFEDSISQQVAGALALKLTGDEQERLSRNHTKNNEAYLLYLKGRYFWNKRTAEGLQKGIEHFEMAIQIDQNYALAFAGLADCYILMGSYTHSQLSPLEAMPKAKAAAERALAIDNSLAEAHVSLAFIKLYYDWDWHGVEREFARALELNPNYDTAHHWFSHYLTAMGRKKESLAECRHALKLNPTDVVLNQHLGWHFLMAREYEEAVSQCRKTLEMDKDFLQAHRVLGLAYLYSGLPEEALRELQRVFDLTAGAPVSRALLAQAYAMSNRTAEAKEALREIERQAAQRYVSSADIAAVFVALGESDQAFLYLQKAYQEHSISLVNIKVDPAFDPLRTDPRFAQLLGRLGLGR
jgi:DNA-binding winged helix-turn-helix (wHTH) protein/tetratricopeptide (TPR) repeat protein